jgi:GNAT superfamily N-acetyltransferase
MKSILQRLSGQQQTNEGPLRVVPVEERRGLRQFIRLPWSIYRDDPAWVPPLLLERKEHLSKRNPFFEHAKWKFWLAYRGATPVGRISAQIDQLHLKRYEDSTGFFGLLEAEEETDTFRVLMNTAETWLRDQGMRRVLGPFNLSINQECGLLVEGFDTPPMVMMGHARPYYSAKVEENGYRKEKDLLAYRINSDFELTRAMRVVVKRAKKRVHLRPLRRSVFKEELRILQDIFEDAWSQNWGFVPFTKAEFEHMGKSFKLLLPDDQVQIAEVDGVPAAFMVAVPNVFPLGWLRLLWRLKVAYPKSVRVALMGVRQRYQNSRLAAALAVMVVEAARPPAVKRGVLSAEMSWILEDNIGMRSIIESLGGKEYKRYRIYSKELA